jgi:hypothetical protein
MRHDAARTGSRGENDLTECTTRAEARTTYRALHVMEAGQPPASDVAERSRYQSTEDIRDVMVSHIDCRKAHAKDEWEEDPEEPPAVPPSTPQRRGRPRDVLRRECGAMNAAALLDYVDQRGEWAACQRTMPHSREGEPRALYREQHGDDIAQRVANRGVRHHRPIASPFAAMIENGAQN